MDFYLEMLKEQMKAVTDSIVEIGKAIENARIAENQKRVSDLTKSLTALIKESGEIRKRVADDTSITTINIEHDKHIKQINVLGVVYMIKEVEVVNKAETRKGEIDFLTNEIKIDKSMPQSLKNQVLMHEILHATFDLLGLSELAEDEEKVQSIATALHQIFTTQTIFSF